MSGYMRWQFHAVDFTATSLTLLRVNQMHSTLGMWSYLGISWKPLQKSNSDFLSPLSLKSSLYGTFGHKSGGCLLLTSFAPHRGCKFSFIFINLNFIKRNLGNQAKTHIIQLIFIVAKFFPSNSPRPIKTHFNNANLSLDRIQQITSPLLHTPPSFWLQCGMLAFCEDCLTVDQPHMKC